MRVRFGSCVFDSASRSLKRDGASLALSPKAFQLLELLLARRPAVLGKQELHDALWPSTFVSESSLARLANELRTTLSDDAREPRFVRTVHGFGYAFVAEASEEAAPDRRPAPRFHIRFGSRELPLVEGENVLGRADDAAVRIDSTKASRRHARITIERRQATIEDLGSKNGTFLCGKRLDKPVQLSDGDQIVIGPTLLTFRAGPSVSTETDSSLPSPVGRRGSK